MTDLQANVYKAVEEAIQAGLCVVPPNEDGSKSPMGNAERKWKPFQQQKPSESQIQQWYGPGRDGVGFICGKVSGNLEVLDFDEQNVYHAFRMLCEQYGCKGMLTRIESSYLEYSPKGTHLLYRCEEIEGGKKLAMRPRTPEEIEKDGKDEDITLIETRGEGNYIIVAPSGGKVYGGGKSYTLMSGSIATIPTITPEERNTLHQLARVFNRESEDKVKHEVERLKKETTSKGGRPGDEFNAKATWDEVLTPHGWERVGYDKETELWRRPGKNYGLSATVNHAGNDLFHCFTSSTKFEVNKACTKFTAYAILNHHGDQAAAASELARKGYGEPITQRPNLPPDLPEWSKPRCSLFFSMANLIDEEITVSYLVNGLIERGTTGQLFGPSGGGKTFTALDVGMGVATGGETLNGRRAEKGVVLYLAGEGRRGLVRRCKAYREHHTLDKEAFNSFHVSARTIGFNGEGIVEVMQEAKALEEHAGEPIALIVIDTLARHMEGDENSTRDMGEFIKAVDMLRDAFPGCVALIIHHTGYGEDKSRSRGSSALKAAMDFEMKVDKGEITFTKMKDGELPPPLEFKLVPVVVGYDDDGEELTSCVVEYGEKSIQNKRRSLTGAKRDLVNALQTVSSGPFRHEDGGMVGALEGDWRKEYYELRTRRGDETKRKSWEKAFNRNRDDLVAASVVTLSGNAAFLAAAYLPDFEVTKENQAFCTAGDRRH